LPIKPGMQILDVGIGYAYSAIKVERIDSNLRITGIDISKKCVKSARKILDFYLSIL